MSSAKNHAARSRYSYHTPKPFMMFGHNAAIKSYKRENNSLLSKLFHKTTNK